MAHDADANRAAKRWLWLLVLPLIAMVWVPSYSKIEPQMFGFPFSTGTSCFGSSSAR
ncbi:hypothetical protein C7S13_2032 [Burkholderia cepacia]|nr:hypothetical protein [Burkholderia cepacia]